MAQKNRSFLSCYFKSNPFLFGSSEIYANVWAQSHTGPHPGKIGKGWRHIFQLRKEKVWARIYKLDKCVCIWKQAIFQVSMLIILTVTKVKVLLVKEAKKLNAT